MAKTRQSAAIRSRNELNHFMMPLEHKYAELLLKYAELLFKYAELREHAALTYPRKKVTLPLRKEFDDTGAWQWCVAWPA